MSNNIDVRISLDLNGEGLTITDFKACKVHGAFCTLRLGEDNNAAVLFRDISASTLKRLISIADVNVVEAKD